MYLYSAVGPSSFWIFRVHDYKDAVNNDQEAINSLIITYLLGPVFDDDRIKGYYWILRSRELPISEKARDQLLKSLSFVSKSQRAKAEGWLSSGHVPPM